MQRRRGFSLIEVMVVIGIMGICLSMTMLNLMSRVGEEGSRGLAFGVAAELRAARSESVRCGVLTAVCFPNDRRGNPVSRSCLTRKGDQFGLPGKNRIFDKESKAGLFIGSWPGSTPAPNAAPSGWLGDSSQDYAVFFRPDGSMVTNGLPLVNGRLPLVAASRVNSRAAGNFFEAAGLQNPYTVWIDSNGTVSVSEGQSPNPALPRTGSDLNCAAVPDVETVGAHDPHIQQVTFFPSNSQGLDKIGLGQTYIQIHPDQKSSTLEYGLVTMLVNATDLDGGPLFFNATCTPSSGSAGNFTVTEQTGRMTWVDGAWRASISWRPPPAAPPNTEYRFEITVKDAEGHTDVASTGAGTIPLLLALQPARIALSSSNQVVYVANLDGGDCVNITPAGENDHDPFFSPDGTKLYTFSNSASGLNLVYQNSDGTGRHVVRGMPVDRSQIKFDPLYMFGAYTHSFSDLSVDYNITVSDGGGSSSSDSDSDSDSGDGSGTGGGGGGSHSHVELRTASEQINVIEVLHLASSTDVQISTKGRGSVHWDPNGHFRFKYTKAVPQIDADGVGQPPGIIDETKGKRLVNFPPVAEDADVSDSDDDQWFNPTDSNFYMRYNGHSLIVGGAGGTQTLHDGALQGKPAWSGNGLTVTYKSGSSVYVQDVFNSGMVMNVHSPVPLNEVPSGASHPDISPDGKWIYYMYNHALWRIDRTGANRKNLTPNLPGGVVDYALST